MENIVDKIPPLLYGYLLRIERITFFICPDFEHVPKDVPGFKERLLSSIHKSTPNQEFAVVYKMLPIFFSDSNTTEDLNNLLVNIRRMVHTALATHIDSFMINMVTKVISDNTGVPPNKFPVFRTGFVTTKESGSSDISRLELLSVKVNLTKLTNYADQIFWVLESMHLIMKLEFQPQKFVHMSNKLKTEFALLLERMPPRNKGQSSGE